MDVLAANMEYHSQDYAAFMQQYGLPANDWQLVRFVERNVISLQSDKMLRIFMPYYQDASITYDIMVRGFISNFMGAQNVLDWDSIILNVLLYGRECESGKQRDFYVRLRGCKDAQETLGRHLTDIFGVSYNDDSKEKVTHIVKVFKYNVIVQNLAPVAADNYKQTRITDSVALQHMNRILELALSKEKQQKPSSNSSMNWAAKCAMLTSYVGMARMPITIICRRLFSCRLLKRFWRKRLKQNQRKLTRE